MDVAEFTVTGGHSEEGFKTFNTWGVRRGAESGYQEYKVYRQAQISWANIAHVNNLNQAMNYQK